MNIIRYLYLKRAVRRDERYLLRKGVEKAAKLKWNILIGTSGEKLVIDNAEGELPLTSLKEGVVDAREILALAADDYPDVAQRYLVNRDKLDS